MQVSVTYRDGRPVPNIRVEIEWESGGRSTQYTDSGGTASFPGNGGVFSSVYVAGKHVRGRGRLVYGTHVSVVYD